MGAENFEEIGKGTSAYEAFSSLCENAKRNYGYNSYNGSISTCSLGRCIKEYEKFSEDLKNRVYHSLCNDNSMHYEKWKANYIDLGVVNYQVVTIKKVAKQYSAKPKLRYVIFKDGKPTDYDFLKKTDADKKAICLALEEKDTSSNFSVKKVYVTAEGNSEVSSFFCEIKEYKNKPNIKPSSNRKIVAIHKYLFFGMAAT